MAKEVSGQRGIPESKTLTLDGDQMGIVRAALDMALTSAQRQQNAKSSNRFAKTAYADYEREIRAVRVLFD